MIKHIQHYTFKKTLYTGDSPCVLETPSKPIKMLMPGPHPTESASAPASSFLNNYPSDSHANHSIMYKYYFNPNYKVNYCSLIY